MTTKKNLALLISGVFATTLASQAAVIVTHTTSASANAYTGDIVNNDLVNAGEATLSSFDGGSPYDGNATWDHGAAGVNDGGGDTTSTNTVGQENSFYWTGGPQTIQFDLDTSLNTLGYDLTDINVYSGWSGNFENNQYTVQYSVVGSATYALLGTANFTGDVVSRLVTFTEDTTGVLASGVDSIRFNLTEASMNNVINEIDILGSATIAVPEPSSFALLGGLLALGHVMVRRRRR